MAKKRKTPTPKKKKSTGEKLLRVGAGVGNAIALYRLIGTAFFCVLLIGFGLLFAFVGGTAEPMSPAELKAENDRRALEGKPPIKKNPSKAVSIGIGVALILLGMLIFAVSFYSYKFVRSDKRIAAVYGGYEGVQYMRRKAPRTMRILL